MTVICVAAWSSCLQRCLGLADRLSLCSEDFWVTVLHSVAGEPVKEEDWVLMIAEPPPPSWEDNCVGLALLGRSAHIVLISHGYGAK